MPKNPKELAGAIISLMSNETLRQQMGDKGRLKALEYDWEHITQRLLNYYAKVLNETR